MICRHRMPQADGRAFTLLWLSAQAAAVLLLGITVQDAQHAEPSEHQALGMPDAMPPPHGT